MPARHAPRSHALLPLRLGRGSVLLSGRGLVAQMDSAVGVILSAVTGEGQVEIRQRRGHRQKQAQNGKETFATHLADFDRPGDIDNCRNGRNKEAEQDPPAGHVRRFQQADVLNNWEPAGKAGFDSGLLANEMGAVTEQQPEAEERPQQPLYEMPVEFEGLMIDLDIDLAVSLSDLRLKRLKFRPGEWVFDIGKWVLHFRQRILDFDGRPGPGLFRWVWRFQTELDHGGVVQFVQFQTGKAAAVLDENVCGRLGANRHVGERLRADFENGDYVRGKA